jgi:hypothetical protein
MSEDEMISETVCPKCEAGTTLTRPCSAFDCDEGLYHDCGEDTCCCADPEPDTECDVCKGYGNIHWCPACGHDLNTTPPSSGQAGKEGGAT